MYSSKDEAMSVQHHTHICVITLTMALSLIAAPLVAEETVSTSPEEISEVAPEKTKLERGKELFTSICSHCHNITYDYSAIGAPGLQGVLERHDETWINTWLSNPEAFAKTDVTARDLVESNPYGLVMPTFPAMQDEKNRRAVIEYLKTLK